MTAVTPGTWEADGHDRVIAREGTRTRVVCILAHETWLLLPERHELARANGRLIAAAKELREACEALTESVTDWIASGDPGPEGSVVRAGLVAARAALAKAGSP